MNVLEECRYEIEPALFIVHALGDVMAAVTVKTVLPPTEKCSGRFRFGHSQKTDVIDAGLKDVQLALMPVVAGQRS